MTQPDLPPEHPEQLRSRIDRGATGDKVAAPDPAAAPLGTDEEAAGTPVPPHAVAAAHAAESAGPPVTRRAHPRRMALVVGLAAVVLALGWMLVRRG